MEELLNLIWHDIQVSFSGITVKDLARPIFLLLWLFIVLIPLTRVDRRDTLAGAVYVLFCMASGVALVWALPQTYVSDKPTMYNIFLSMLIMSAISAFRWFYRSHTYEFTTHIDNSNPDKNKKEL